MTRLVGLNLRRENVQYSLDIDWNDESFVDHGSVHFEIIATRTPDGGEPRDIKASVRLEGGKGESPDVVIDVAGYEVFRDSLANLTGENAIFDKIPGEVFAFGDPILGCLVRAGISATVSQILTCRDNTGGQGWGGERLVAIGRCLLQNGVRIGARTLWRAGKCIATG